MASGLFVLLSTLCHSGVSVTHPQAAVVRITGAGEFASLDGPHLSYFATFSKLPPVADWFAVWAPSEDEFGCTSYGGLPASIVHPWVSIVRRGNCTFLNKTLQAQHAGAIGAVIVSDSEDLILLSGFNESASAKDLTLQAGVTIFAVSVPLSLGNAIVNSTFRHRIGSEQAVQMSFQVYKVNYFDLAEACLVCLATFLVAAGAYFSTSDMRVGSPLAPHHEEVVELDNSMAIAFCFAGSIMLMVLFFFMKWMIYFLIFAFCVGGASCAVQILSSWFQYLFPQLKRAVQVPFFGYVAYSELIACIPSGLLILGFLMFRNKSCGWIFQDLIGAGFLCMMQRTLRLPNIQVATLLLSAMFFFDIFWVFLSPLLFRGKSVMVEVAKGGGTGESVPMLLRIPALGDPLGSDRMLGFGDIALPGLLISYLLRHDIMSKRRLLRGYFMPSLVGYFVGLCITIAALFIMKMGQPALLYLVPATLGTTLVLGWCRSELRLLWLGKPATNAHGDADEGREMVGHSLDES